MQAQFSTPWVGYKATRPMTDEERHSLFCTHVREVAGIKMPWLFPLLDASAAAIYTQPGVFLFVLPSNPTTWHDVPEMANLIASLPWVDQDSKPQ